MKVLPLLSLLLLMATSGLGAQPLPGDGSPAPERPLNLSVRKSLPPVTDAKPVPVPRYLPTDRVQPAGQPQPLILPYGAGFETRQQGNASGNGAAAGGGGGGGSGNGGGGGRGGSGRGR